MEAPVWREAVAGLPRGGAVLDLATGDGVVAAGLKRLRRDLAVVGVDSAAALPPAPPGVELRPGVAMEALPFEAGAFDLVASRFGAEYGDRARVAGEAARVLRPGGRLVWLCHHRDSPVVVHNAARARALTWAAKDSGLLARARAIATARRRLPLPIPPDLVHVVAQARARFPDQAAAAEFATAVVQSLGGPRPAPPDASLRMLDELGVRAAAELARLGALQGAALDANGAAALAGMLREAGLAAEPPAAVRSEAGAPYAWRIRAARA